MKNISIKTLLIGICVGIISNLGTPKTYTTDGFVVTLIFLGSGIATYMAITLFKPSLMFRIQVYISEHKREIWQLFIGYVIGKLISVVVMYFA